MGKTKLYQQAKELFNTIGINQTVIMEQPDNMPLFRKYLSELSKGNVKQVRTKTENKKLYAKAIERIIF